jgi:NAD+ diphosphatase
MTLNFISQVSPVHAGDAPAYWFIFQEDRLLMWPGGSEKADIPRAWRPAALGITTLRELYLGCIQDEGGMSRDCYGAEVAADAPLPEGVVAEGLRQAYPRLDETLFAVAGRAVQIVAWDRTHRFCGQCGAATERLDGERGRRCPACGLVSYPRISPAIIIAVVRGEGPEREVLLARNHRFPPGRYSVVAGYVEPGESLEECAHREVAEETGIRIRDLRYFGSQPWPFPNSLMIGFTAAYDGGEITLEESELADARWFAAGALPDLPPKMTIARKLIDWFSS